MPDHWPEWTQQEVNWQQQGSYVEPLEVPLPDPTAGTLVCLPPMNQACLRYVAGCLDQLRNPSTYDGLSDADIATSLINADLLRGMLARAVPCEAPVSYELRLNACVLEQSTDGGATWTAVSGWDGLAACLPSLGTDAIAIPSNPLGVSTIQQACNIAGYVAQQIIQGVFNTLQQAISEGRSAIQFATDLTVGAFIFRSVFPYTTAVLLGIDALLSLGASIGASELATIVADVVLWDDIKCAIYHAILVDGHITAANWPVAIANIRAISYSVPGVSGGIADWLQSVDMATVYEWQQLAPLDSVDCTDCGWCYEFSAARGNLGAWSRVAGDPFDFFTVTGSGWESVTLGGFHTQELDAQISFTAVHVSTVVVEATAPHIANGATRAIQYTGHSENLSTAAGASSYTMTVNGTINKLVFYYASANPPDAARNYVTRVTVRGTGTCPFGTPNC